MNILISCVQNDLRGAWTNRLHECTIKSKEKQIRDFNFLRSMSAFMSYLPLFSPFFKKQIWDWIVLVYHFNKWCYQWGANSKLTQISANPLIVPIMEKFQFEVKTNQIKSTQLLQIRTWFYSQLLWFILWICSPVVSNFLQCDERM